MTAGRLRIPAREVENTVAAGVRLRLAPRERALVSSGRAIGRALKLPLGRKPGAAPARVGLRLGVADVDRPGGRKRDRLEESPPNPASLLAFPERRMPEVLASHPVPVGRTPEAWLPVARGVDELQEGGVGHVPGFDRE